MNELTRSEKISLGTTEIAKQIRTQLKEKMPGKKFSVTIERYSGGSSITVALMSSDIKIIKDFKDIETSTIEQFICRGYPSEGIKTTQSRRDHQLSPYALRDDYNITGWCNGVFLTKEGHDMLREVVKVADQYNYDNSDSRTDYYDVNFHFSVHIGKWNKDFVDGGVSA